MMCIIDDDGVGIRDIDTVLHDGCGEQHVIVVVDEPHNDFLQFLGFHLSMSDGHSSIRHILLNEQRQFRQVTDPVVDEEHLSVTAHLELNGLSNDLTVEGMHLGMDGIAVGRWCLDNTHVTGSHQGELQCSRNRRGTHGERIHIGLQLAQLLFRGDAELLFLINDEQPKVFELHRLTDELMRTDDNIDLSRFQIS